MLAASLIGFPSGLINSLALVALACNRNERCAFLTLSHHEPICSCAARALVLFLRPLPLRMDIRSWQQAIMGFGQGGKLLPRNCGLSETLTTLFFWLLACRFTLPRDPLAAGTCRIVTSDSCEGGGNMRCGQSLYRSILPRPPDPIHGSSF